MKNLQYSEKYGGKFVTWELELGLISCMGYQTSISWEQLLIPSELHRIHIDDLQQPFAFRIQGLYVT